MDTGYVCVCVYAIAPCCLKTFMIDSPCKEFSKTPSKYKVKTLYTESVFLFSMVSLSATLQRVYHWVLLNSHRSWVSQNPALMLLINTSMTEWTGNADSPEKPRFLFDQNLSIAGGRQCCAKKEKPTKKPDHVFPHSCCSPVLANHFGWKYQHRKKG